MFQYNKPCVTNTGETVTPYAKEGEFIACFDSNGNTVYKKIKDFSTKKEPKIISAVPKEPEEKKQEVKVSAKKIPYVEKIELELPVKPIKENVVEEKVEQSVVTAPKEKAIVKSSSEGQSIRKKDTWKKENNSKYKGNNIEE